MSNQQKILNGQQNDLVIELTETYGIEPEDIIFFSGDPKPVFSYEATCAIANDLIKLHSVDIEPIDSPFQDSLSLRCHLQIGNDRGDVVSRSAVGVANTSETDGDNKQLTDQQLYQLASGRAIRNALKTAGIDLLKLHYQAKRGVEYTGEPKSNYQSLLAQAHALGEEAGFICGKDKGPWYSVLDKRYVVRHSSDLTEVQLANFVAFLKGSIAPARKAA